MAQLKLTNLLVPLLGSFLLGLENRFVVLEGLEYPYSFFFALVSFASVFLNPSDLFVPVPVKLNGNH